MGSDALIYKPVIANDDSRLSTVEQIVNGYVKQQTVI
jgi:hypothetical protein